MSRTGLKTLFLTLLSIGVVVGCLIASRVHSQTQRDESDAFYYFEGRKIPFTIALNQIGVFLKESSRTKDFAELSRLPGARVARQLPGGLLILDLGRTYTRAELFTLARQIKTGSPDTIIRAGLVVTAGGAEDPALLTDEFIVKLKNDNPKAQIDSLTREYTVEVVRENPFVKNEFLLRMTPAAVDRQDALTTANQLNESGLTEYAFPNFASPVIKDDAPPPIVPNDPLFGDEWHLRNTGQNGGTVGADSRAAVAWNITQGSQNIVIAVLEPDGFDANHPDLIPNLWANPGEVGGNGVDDDGNGLIDDTHGWNFGPCETNNVAGCGSNQLTPEQHGTNSAGVAAARGNNSIGVSGSCPNCALMLIQFGDYDDFLRSMAFDYARTEGAHIISNSWHTAKMTFYPKLLTAFNTAATEGRGGKGIVIFQAAGNTYKNICVQTGPTPDIHSGSLPNVISVSTTNHKDQRVNVVGENANGFGNCVDILAPTNWIVTTDVFSPDGNSDNDYNKFYSGTSAATPIAAGLGALLLTVNPNLTRQEVQHLLQDTADKVEPSVGNYDYATGFSGPASHSWGRINAFEAVRIAAPTSSSGGKAGVDIFLRDNVLDWGNTDQPSNTTFEPTRGFIPHWQSADIKVDSPGSSGTFQPAPTSTASFEALTDLNAVSGVTNRVYVRVRNRGPVAASTVTVKLYWAFAGLGLPSLPTDFWKAFPADSADSTQWHPLGTRTITSLNYSGASVANCPGRAQPDCGGATDAAQIVAFDFPGPPIDSTKLNPDHFCLLVILDSDQDHVGPRTKPPVPSDFVPDYLTPMDNNVTHRNIKVVSSSGLADFGDQLFINNPTDQNVQAVLRFSGPKCWIVKPNRFGFNKPFWLKPKEQVLVKVRFSTPDCDAGGNMTIRQETLAGNKTFIGGMTYKLRKTR